ncbi:MAG: sulfotransferase [Halioglobus sp.]
MVNACGNYVIGVGSQRCGTTLLHKVLVKAANVNLHPVKELHYFDTKHGLRSPQLQMSRALGRAKRQLRRPHLLLTSRGRFEYRVNMLLANNPPGSYEYRDLYAGIPPAGVLGGEITPDYMLLAEQAIDDMRDSVGDASIILMTRDPFDRLVSSMKLYLHSHMSEMNPQNASYNEMVVKTLMDKPAWVERQLQYNDYEVALKRYRARFSKVLELPYEEFLVADKGAMLLQEFLELPVDRKKYQKCLAKKVNSFLSGFRPSQELQEAVKSRFSL